MFKSLRSKKSIILSTLLTALFTILLACGGGEEVTEVVTETPSEKPTETSKTETTEPEFEEGSLNVTLEILSPPTAIDVLEGKAQFRTPGAEEWVDVIDAQPIEAGWSVRTLAVSRAVLKFVDGSQLAIKPSTQITIDKFDIVNGGPAQGLSLIHI